MNFRHIICFAAVFCVALNTASPHRILKNAAYANAKAPEAFWRDLGI